MKRAEIHPNIFIFMEVAEIKPSLEMVLHTEEPGAEILTNEIRKLARDKRRRWIQP